MDNKEVASPQASAYFISENQQGMIMKKFLLGLAAFLTFGLLTPAIAADQVPQNVQQMQLTFAPLVKATSPAVVNIYAKVKVQQRTQVMNPFMADPLFRQFFNMPGIAGPMQERLENSLGSGVIVDPSGLIATNVHVINNATEITAVTSEGREFTAEKVLVDERTDLAILRINPKGLKLQALEMADSDGLNVGDLVLAIGNPFGVGQTVTSGIISGLSRTVAGPHDYGFFIQTDAAINPGNSGGALIDMQGRLVGINSMIFSKDGGSLGIGFAIPANMVKTVVEASRKGSRIVRPWTGIAGQPVTPDMLDSLKLDRAQGALVNSVHPKGPAAKAGVKAGDVILTMDGKPVEDPVAMRYRLSTMPMGTPVKMEVMRAGQKINLTMQTEPPLSEPPKDETRIKNSSPLSGLTVINISPATADEFGPFAADSGVVITNVDDGNAARIGMRPGDIILAINGTKTPTTAALRDMLMKTKGPRWQLSFQRGDQVMNLNLN